MPGVRFTELQSRPMEFLDFTSVTLDEFQQLVPPFETAFQCHIAAWRMDGKPRTARRFTVYKNCSLPTPEDRLLFILTYVKTYALQLAVIGQKLGKQAQQEMAKIVKPDTIVGWHRKFVAQKFDGSKQRKTPGRPTIDQEVETLVVAHGAGESLLGLRPHRGSSGQPGLYGQRPDHGQHPQVSWHCASARAQDHRHVERISPYAQGHQGRHKTMPCCTLPLVERGECIIGWLMDGEWMRAHRVENV